MKTPEEIKKGLEYVAETNVTRKIDLIRAGIVYQLTEDLAADALAYIRELEAKLVNQATEYSQAPKITTEQRDMLLGTQDKLAALLSYVTGGRFSKTSYSIDEMERFVDDYQQSECAKCDELEQVKVERDAAVADMLLAEADNNFCQICVHLGCNDKAVCTQARDEYACFEWRGVKKQ